MIGKRSLIVLLLALPLICAAPAHAFVYWADSKAGTIGRAANDGSGATDAFIHTGAEPNAVTVDSAHIYWTNVNDNSIGRANLDGTGVNNAFITGINRPSGVAVNGSYIYWSSLNGSEIGRAKLDGSSPVLNFIPAETPCGVALDAGHVYWATASLSNQRIGRASLNGANQEPNWAPISAAGPCGVAVNSANVFWAESGFLGGYGKNIGRVNVNSKEVDNSMIGSAGGPCGVALDTSSHLYWANLETGTIGRARTDATEENESFIATGGQEICGVAVDNLSSPPTPAPTPTPEPVKPASALQLGALKLNPKRGTGTLKVSLGGPGTLTLSGKGVATLKRTVKKGGWTALAIKPKGALLRTLEKKGRASAKVTVTFSQTGDTPTSRTRKLVLKHQAPGR